MDTSITVSRDDCIVCTVGYDQVGGYQRICRDGVLTYAHRWAYEQVYGPIPDGMEIGHLCHNPACWNPDHLRAMTHADNMRQRSDRQTHCKRGHPLSGDNMTVSNGRRRCKACARGYYHQRKDLDRLRASIGAATAKYAHPFAQFDWMAT